MRRRGTRGFALLVTARREGGTSPLLRLIFVRDIIDDTVFCRAAAREREFLRARTRSSRCQRSRGGEMRKKIDRPGETSRKRRGATALPTSRRQDCPRGVSRSRSWSRSRSRRRRRRRRRERTVRGERQACTRDRESQQPATCDTLVYTHRRFWRARSALAARRRRRHRRRRRCCRPIDADCSRPPRTTLTLTPITRNYVSSRGTHAHAYA